MNKNHEPTIWTRIGWHFENNGFGYVLFTFVFAAFGLLIAAAEADSEYREAQRAAQQACVLHGKVPAEVYGKIVCIAPEALR